MWERIRNFITKDTDAENEVKMYSVIMRLVLICNLVYLIWGVVYTGLYSQYEFMAFEIGCIVATLFFFYCTYSRKTIIASIGINLIFVITMIIHSAYYGVNTGIFQLIYVMTILICILDFYKYKVSKFICLVLALSCRIVVYTFFQNKAPIYGSSDLANAHWQIANMIIFAAMIIFAVVVATADFTEMRKKLTRTNSNLRDMAGRDPLTGLYNRRSAQKYIEECINQFESGQIEALTLVMADIDHFKTVNDTYGHDNGDEVIRTMSNIMGASMRGKGVAARWGGEEFLLVYVNANGDNACENLYELQREIGAQSFRFDGKDVKITFTFGVAEFGYGSNLDATIKEADEKLYLGKARGRNVVIF